MSEPQDDTQLVVSWGGGRSISLPPEFVSRAGDLRTDTLTSVNGRLVKTRQSLLHMHPSEDDPSRQQMPLLEYYTPFCGLLEPLSYLIDSAGTEIRLPFIHRSTLQPPQTADVINHSVTGMMHARPWGIVEMGSGVTQAEVIVDVCRGFPNARVLVLGPHIDPLARVCQSIHETAPDITSVDVTRGVHTPECPDPDADEDEIVRAQLVFTTYLNAGVLHDTEGTAYNLFDIVLCLQPELIQGHHNTLFLYGDNIRFRHFGLLSVDRRLSTPERHQLMNVFGFRRVRIPASGYARSAVSFVSIRNARRARNVTTRNQPHQNLMRLQSDRQRNLLIAEWAMDLAGPRSTPIDDPVGSWVSGNTDPNEPLTIVIVASDSRQAARLASVLPGWPVLEVDVPTGAEVLQNLPLTPGGLIERIICTREAMERLPTECNPNIIINATGGPYALQLPTRWMRHRLGTPMHNRRRLIVDLDDRGTRLTGIWSQSRFQGYEQNDVFRFDHTFTNASEFSFASLRRFLVETFQTATR